MDEKVKKSTSFQEAIQSYLDKHNLTQGKLAEKIHVSENTIKNWMRKKNPREPQIGTLYHIADVLGLTFDELLTGIATPDVDARSRTGLSDKSIENLAQLNDEYKKSEECAGPYTPHRDMLPFIDALLSDSAFLRNIEWKIHRLICLKAEYGAYGDFDEVGDRDLADGITFAISRAFLDKVDDYVEGAVKTEERRVRKQDLIDMAESIQKEEAGK